MGLFNRCSCTDHTFLSPAKMFGDLKSAAGVKALDEFLAEHSYIEGFVPSQADTAVFEALAGAPKSDTPHALRWYNHIKSFAAGMKQFPKAEKDASAYVSGAAADAAPAADDDDDVDLFGSDEEEDDEEKKRITEERLAAYAAKKAKNPALIAKTSVLLDVKPWDDETDMDAMLAAVKSIEMEGLLWGANKLVPWDMESTNCKLCVLLRMPRFPSMSCRRRLVISKTS